MFLMLLMLTVLRFHESPLPHPSPVFLFNSDTGWETQTKAKAL